VNNLTIDIIGLAQWITAIGIILGALGILFKKLKPLYSLKNAVKKLYHDAFIEEAQEKIDSGKISDAEYVLIKDMYKTYTENLGGDKNGLPKSKMDTVEEMHKGSNIKSEVQGMIKPALNRKPIILAVDDAETWCFLIKRALQQDYEVLTTTNPLDANLLLHQMNPELLIVDNAMPEISGVDLVKQIRKTPSFRRTPIIMLTGCEDDETKQKAYDEGVDKFLTKPFKDGELREIVDSYLK